MIYFETWNIYLLFKHCCYCFVRWSIYHWIFCRKVNRKYKHNTSCTLNNHRRKYRRKPVRRHLTESLKIITLKCHNHRRPYRRTYVRRHLTESSKIITPKCHNHRRPYRRIYRCLYRRIYRRLYRRNLSVGNLSMGKFTDKNTDGMREFQRVWIKCTSVSVILPTESPTNRENFGGNSKITDGFKKLIIFFLYPSVNLPYNL